MARLVVVGSACAALLLGAPFDGAPFDSAQGRQARPVFRSAARTVYIYATVQNKDGRLVTNLTKDDFEVFDNGQPQAVTVFANEPQKITMALLFDMSASMVKNLPRLREASVAFVRALWPDDRVRIGSFGDEVALSPILTNDKPTLLRILDEELWPGGSTPLWRAIQAAMNSLEDEPGRRVVLSFTDGKNATLFAGGGSTEPDVSDSRHTTRARAERDAVMIYAIGLQGTGLHDSMESLAEDTGGGHFLAKREDDLGQTFSQVVEELHHQYVIGFSTEVLDGQSHKLKVQAKPPGMKVRARKSYLAATDGAGR
jgi:Ca-activated chloride channel family protein